MSQQSESLALYVLDMNLYFAGPLPGGTARRTPEVSVAHREAVEAAQEVMRRHGFTITRTCHGARRCGTYTPAALTGEQR